MGSKGTVSDPHAVLGGVPELLRLADGWSDAQLQEIPTARSDYPVIELYRGGDEELQRHGSGSHFPRPLLEQTP